MWSDKSSSTASPKVLDDTDISKRNKTMYKILNVSFMRASSESMKNQNDGFYGCVKGGFIWAPVEGNYRTVRQYDFFSATEL